MIGKVSNERTRACDGRRLRSFPISHSCMYIALSSCMTISMLDLQLSWKPRAKGQAGNQWWYSVAHLGDKDFAGGACGIAWFLRSPPPLRCGCTSCRISSIRPCTISRRPPLDSNTNTHLDAQSLAWRYQGRYQKSVHPN